LRRETVEITVFHLQDTGGLGFPMALIMDAAFPASPLDQNTSSLKAGHFLLEELPGIPYMSPYIGTYWLPRALLT
jgi:hypothetical protein